MTKGFFSELSELSDEFPEVSKYLEKQEAKASMQNADSVPNKPVEGISIKKRKATQGVNSANNSLTFIDNTTGVKFTVNIGISAYKKDCENVDCAINELRNLQAIVTKFVEELPNQL